jgi:hypothetical protein
MFTIRSCNTHVVSAMGALLQNSYGCFLPFFPLVASHTGSSVPAGSLHPQPSSSLSHQHPLQLNLGHPVNRQQRALLGLSGPWFPPPEAAVPCGSDKGHPTPDVIHHVLRQPAVCVPQM